MSAPFRPPPIPPPARTGPLDPRDRVRRLAWVGLACLATLAVAACLELPTARPHPATTPAEHHASAAGTEPDRPAPGLIRVRLGSTTRPASITSEGELVVSAPSGELLHRGPEVTLTPSTGRLLLEGRDVGPGPLTVRPGDGHPLSYAGTAYRGTLRVRALPAVGMAQVENDLLLDDYLLGVLPREMPDRFGLEALKAQAVAARSYALYEVSRRGWVFDDTRSQVYGGIPAESALSTRAVRETRGQVLTAGGTPIKAWFHSTCGGLTAPAAELFADARSGVLDRPVPCPDCRHSPYHSWSRRFSSSDFVSRLGLGLPSLSAVELDTDPSGRTAMVEIRGASKSARVDGESFRSRLSSGRPIREQVLSTWISAPPRLEGDAVVIDGRGWGHGVGMCQYGASGFARRGASHDAILRRYYPGAELSQLP